MIITQQGIQITYPNFRREIMLLSKKLTTRGLAVILCSNTLGCIHSYLACLKSRVVPLLLSANISKENLLNIIEVYDAKYLCISQKSIAQKTDIKGTLLTSVYDYVIYERETSTKPMLHEDLALLLTTSGSTGNAKCVRISRKNLISNTKAICESLNIQSTDRAITSLPMNYTYGLSVLHTHLYMGATILLTDKSVLSPEFWNFFEREKGTSFAGVPFTYECLYKLGVFQRNFEHLRVMTQAGGKLSLALQEYYGKLSEKKGMRFYIMYGQTEATARMSVLPYNEVIGKMGSVGVPIPGGRFEIIDGEVVYYGDNVSMGYADTIDDLIRGDENDGVLRTGDAGYIEDGFLYVIGRIDRFAKINGERIFLPDLEEMIREEIGKELTCIYQERYLYIVTEETIPNDDWQRIMNWIRQNVPVAMDKIKKYEIRNLPRNSIGKVDYSMLIRLLKNQELRNTNDL